MCLFSRRYSCCRCCLVWLLSWLWNIGSNKNSNVVSCFLVTNHEALFSSFGSRHHERIRVAAPTTSRRTTFSSLQQASSLDHDHDANDDSQSIINYNNNSTNTNINAISNNKKLNLTILLVDHYDSYTYNLYDMICRLCIQPPIVITKDDHENALSNGTLLQHVDGIVLSPGPGRPPEDTGISLELIRSCPHIPILGVCLGHQAIGYAYGANVIAAPTTNAGGGGPIHGQVHGIHYDDTHVLFGNNLVPQSQTTKRPQSQSLLQVTRYHSLIVQLPPSPSSCSKNTNGNDCHDSHDNKTNDTTSICTASASSIPLKTTAWYRGDNNDNNNSTATSNNDNDDFVMALAHMEHPHFGVQFHPESIGTPQGMTILSNFLEVCQKQREARRRKGEIREVSSLLPAGGGVNGAAASGSSGAGAAVGKSRTTGGPPFPVRQEGTSTSHWQHNGNCHPCVAPKQRTLEQKTTTTSTTTTTKRQQQHQRRLKVHVRRVGRRKVKDKPLQTAAAAIPSPSDVFATLYANHSFATWLDSSSSVSSSSTTSCRPCSILAALDGPLSRRIEYDVDDQVVREYNADGRELECHEETNILSFLRHDMDNIVHHVVVEGNDDKDDLPFDYRGGYLGFLGYEVRKDTLPPSLQRRRRQQHSRHDEGCKVLESSGRQRQHQNSTSTKKHPSAAFLFADRSLVFDHWKEEWYLVGLSEEEEHADTWNEAAQDLSILQWMDKVERLLWTMESSRAVIQKESESSRCSSRRRRQQQRRRQPPLAFVPNRSPQTYRENIATCHEQIRLGESYELCLTNQLGTTASRELSPLDLYQQLRKRNPVPHAAFVNFQQGPTPLSICCSSPERFVSVKKQSWKQKRRTPSGVSLSSLLPTSGSDTLIEHEDAPDESWFVVEAKPIKGTCARQVIANADDDHGAARRPPQTAVAESLEDVRRAHELETSVKNRAENLMIVDLLRNDLHRVCRVGSVHVPKLMRIESFATVHQMVSTVRGVLRDDKTCMDVLQSCFPGGSMTGAPKVRSMDILHELEEGVPRGPYSGCLGYISLNGSMDMNIVIRSAVLTPSTSSSNDDNDDDDDDDELWDVTIGAGGAITALSKSQDEYDEMLLKARAVMEAVQAWVDEDCNANDKRKPTDGVDNGDTAGSNKAECLQESTNFAGVLNMTLATAAV